MLVCLAGDNRTWKMKQRNDSKFSIYIKFYWKNFSVKIYEKNSCFISLLIFKLMSTDYDGKFFFNLKYIKKYMSVKYYIIFSLYAWRPAM